MRVLDIIKKSFAAALLRVHAAGYPDLLQVAGRAVPAAAGLLTRSPLILSPLSTGGAADPYQVPAAVLLYILCSLYTVYV